MPGLHLRPGVSYAVFPSEAGMTATLTPRSQLQWELLCWLGEKYKEPLPVADGTVVGGAAAGGGGAAPVSAGTAKEGAAAGGPSHAAPSLHASVLPYLEVETIVRGQGLVDIALFLAERACKDTTTGTTTGSTPGTGSAETATGVVAHDNADITGRDAAALAAGLIDPLGPSASVSASGIVPDAATLSPHTLLALLRHIEAGAYEQGPAVVNALARRGDPQCLEAVDTFLAFYGHCLGTAAQTFLSYSGLFIAGGILPKLAWRLRGPSSTGTPTEAHTGASGSLALAGSARSASGGDAEADWGDNALVRAYLDQGPRMSDLVSRIPLWMVDDGDIGLKGCLYFAQERLGRRASAVLVSADTAAASASE